MTPRERARQARNTFVGGRMLDTFFEELYTVANREPRYKRFVVDGLEEKILGFVDGRPDHMLASFVSSAHTEKTDTDTLPIPFVSDPSWLHFRRKTLDAVVTVTQEYRGKSGN